MYKLIEVELKNGKLIKSPGSNKWSVIRPNGTFVNDIITDRASAQKYLEVLMALNYAKG